METPRLKLTAAFSLFLMLLVLSAFAKSQEPTTGKYNGVGTEAGVSTGQAGTTSGITGSDMRVRDETTGTGQSTADQMVKAGQARPASQFGDTEQPEQEASSSDDYSGEENQGMPQSSNPHYSRQEGQTAGQD